MMVGRWRPVGRHWVGGWRPGWRWGRRSRWQWERRREAEEAPREDEGGWGGGVEGREGQGGAEGGGGLGQLSWGRSSGRCRETRREVGATLRGKEGWCQGWRSRLWWETRREAGAASREVEGAGQRRRIESVLGEMVGGGGSRSRAAQGGTEAWVRAQVGNVGERGVVLDLIHGMRVVIFFNSKGKVVTPTCWSRGKLP